MTKTPKEYAHWLERDGANCQMHIDAATTMRALQAELITIGYGRQEALNEAQRLQAQVDLLETAMTGIASETTNGNSDPDDMERALVTLVATAQGALAKLMDARQ